jgi:hypothetical protein
LSRTDSLKRHEKTCKEKDKELSNVKQLEIQLKIKEQEIIKLKLKLQKSKKADIVTVNQLNKLLLERHKQYQNYINNINNGNINNYNGNYSKKLAEHALDKGSMDNISVIILFF